MKRCTVFKLENVPYDDVLSFQFELVEKVKDTKGKESFLILVEHQPVITVGRNGNGSNILVTEETLKRKGIELKHINRGGDVTYHGPGQLVGYPVLSLSGHKKSVREYIRLLEEVMINTLADFEVKAERHPEYVGVWVNGAKIGFIGVRISRGITYHGFSLNIDADLNAFKLINPCGLRNQKITSLNELVNKKVSLNEVMKVYLKKFSELFNTKPVVVRASLSYIPKA